MHENASPFSKIIFPKIKLFIKSIGHTNTCFFSRKNIVLVISYVQTYVLFQRKSRAFIACNYLFSFPRSNIIIIVRSKTFVIHNVDRSLHDSTSPSNPFSFLSFLFHFTFISFGFLQFFPLVSFLKLSCLKFLVYFF